ncbi:hypothetical protein C451_15923 [Halococcus thailandensis JCM 13552]|uniref:Uncharacterized protein n=1 Tax=Halococcus thailandensis JCM 13552 TaxID=1227457 RepID=M0MZN4_9EURY|nr:hypothetical protein C451_15923 [Halococcus thailandensis JCM 13552]
MVGAATSLGLAGCSSETGENNSSGNGSGDESTEAASGDAETEMESGGESTEAGGDATEASSDEEATDAESEESEDETATESDESSDEESSETDASSGDSESSSVSDSGDTDVSVKSADIADAFSLDSVEYYSEDVSNGVRGEVTNTSDSSISYTGIEVKFYDGEDTRIGEALDNTSDLGGGETYAFDAIGMLDSDKADSIASYTITVSDSAL